MAFSLKAILGLETSKFERGLGRARSKLNSSVGGMMKSLAPILGFVGFGALASNALNAAREIGNLARVANSTPENFQKLAFGAKTVGVDTQKLADIFKDTGDKIGDFLQTGGGPLADFFENIAPKIGVTADMFRDLSGPDALQLYYDSIEKANLSQSEMTFFMEAIASDATLLIPLLKEGGKGFAEFGKKAEEAGLVMSDLEQEKLEKINLKMDVLKKRGTVLAGTFLTKVIPALNILGQGLGFVADIFGVTAFTTVAFGKALGGIIAAVVAPAILRIKSLGLTIKGLGQLMKGDFAASNESIAESKRLAEESAQAFSDIPKKIAAISKELEDVEDAAFTTLGESIETRSKNITDAVDDITGAAEESEDALAEVIIEAKKAAGEVGAIGGDGKGEQIEMEQKLIKLRLDALKAEVRGEKLVAKALENRVKLAERILKIMKETGATREEATVAANFQVKREISEGTASGSTGGSTGGGSTQSSDTVRGNITTGRIKTVGSGTRESRFGPAQTMDERERAAGLNLRGNDTLSGRRGPESLGGKDKAAESNTADPTVKAVNAVEKAIDKLRTDTST